MTFCLRIDNKNEGKMTNSHLFLYGVVFEIVIIKNNNRL
jgi:hypothetical protein